MKLPAHSSIAFVLLASCFVRTQDTPAQGRFLANQEVRVTGLPTRTATARDRTAVLAAALETIFSRPRTVLWQ